MLFVTSRERPNPEEANPRVRAKLKPLGRMRCQAVAAWRMGESVSAARPPNSRIRPRAILHWFVP